MTPRDRGTTESADTIEPSHRALTSGNPEVEVPPEIDPRADAREPESATRASSHEDMSVQEVRERAVTGAAIDLLRGFGVRGIALVGTLVLARLLTPYDFGSVAIGTIFVTVGQFMADGGIGVGLIRRVDAPARADLRALLGFQLGFSTALTAVVVAVMLAFFGELGQVTAIMILALPLTARADDRDWRDDDRYRDGRYEDYRYGQYGQYGPNGRGRNNVTFSYGFDRGFREGQSKGNSDARSRRALPSRLVSSS